MNSTATKGDDFSFQTATRADAPVASSLAQRMGVALMINEQNKVWLVHDAPLGFAVMWAEYDADSASLVLITQEGNLCDLGMTVQKQFRKYLLQAREIYTVYMKDGVTKDAGILPLTVRETGHYTRKA